MYIYIHLLNLIYLYLILYEYDHIHRAKNEKMFWDQKYSQEIKKKYVYMILYANNVIYHAIYII